MSVKHSITKTRMVQCGRTVQSTNEWQLAHLTLAGAFTVQRRDEVSPRPVARESHFDQQTQWHYSMRRAELVRVGHEIFGWRGQVVFVVVV